QVIFLILCLKSKIKLKFVSIIVSLLVLVSLTLPYLDKKVLIQSRTEIWSTAFESIKISPLVGHGFGNIESAMQAAAQNLRNNIRYQYVDSTHNIILDYLVEGGIVGAGLFLMLNFLAIRKFVKQENILSLMLY